MEHSDATYAKAEAGFNAGAAKHLVQTGLDRESVFKSNIRQSQSIFKP